LENTADEEFKVLPGSGDDDGGMPSVGVETVRGDAYSAEADTGGPPRGIVRRAVERTGESGVLGEDRFCDAGDNFAVEEESFSLRRLTVVMLGAAGREGDTLARIVPLPSDRDNRV